MALSIIAYVFVSLFLNYGYLAQKDDTLLMVQILYRHGDRSPVTTFPTNPLLESAWPEGFGQLTQVGMLQHFELGKYLRKRYIEGEPYRLLNSSYNRQEIRLRSTDYDRTLMSSYSNLAGLFPPSGDQVWKEDLLWQPIPVHTVPLDIDHLLKADGSCPKYLEYFRAAMNSEDVKKEEAENQEFYQLLSNKAGVEIEHMIGALKVFDPIFCARSHGFLEPSWVNLTWKGKTIFDKLHELNNWQFELLFNRPGESRLTGGPLLKVMIENMLSRMLDTSAFKSYVYSAHDTTVSAFLSALNVFNGIVPPYASAVLLELHKIDGQHVIRLLYRNDSTRDAYSLQIPGCSGSCSFEGFVSATIDNVPVDWRAECRIKPLRMSAFLLLFGIFIVLVLVLLITLLVYAVQRKRRRYDGYVSYTMG